MMDQQSLQIIAEIASELRYASSTLVGIQNALDSLATAMRGLLLLGGLFLVVYCLKTIGKKGSKWRRK